MALGITPIAIINKGTHPLLVKHTDWERVEISNIAYVQNGYAFSSELFNHKDGLQLIRIRDIFSEKTENYYSGEYDEDFVVNHKDILIGMDGDFKISRWPGQKGLLNQRVCRLKFNSNYYVENFLFICVQPYLDAIHSETSAVTVKHLSSRTINDIPLPLPPLPIQRAIVSKIEALFSDLDNGIANFKKAQEQLKIYRQAVLKKAFEGELTKEWREKQNNLPTAEELLKQIKQERQNHYNQQIEDWKKAVKEWEKKRKVDKMPIKPQSIKEVSALKNEELENLFDLPKGWFWNKFGNVCLKIMDGTHFSPKNIEKGEYKYITAKNIKEGRIDLSNITYVSNHDHKSIYARCDVKRGDVLYIKDGATTGKAAINNLNEEFSLLSSVGVFRVAENVILPKYLEYFLNTEVNKNRMLENVAGVAITRLTLIKLNHCFFSICSLQEQTQIVQKIEFRLSVCDKVEQSITESIVKAEALRQSILKKAFEGKLLSHSEIELCKQAADYEPASELLKKIKAEKFATLQQAQVAKATTKKKSKK